MRILIAKTISPAVPCSRAVLEKHAHEVVATATGPKPGPPCRVLTRRAL